MQEIPPLVPLASSDVFSNVFYNVFASKACHCLLDFTYNKWPHLLKSLLLCYLSVHWKLSSLQSPISNLAYGVKYKTHNLWVTYINIIKILEYL